MMDDYSQLVQRYKELMKKRDEAVAMVEVMRDALAHAKDQLEEWEIRIDSEWGDGRDLDEIEADGELSDATIIVRNALSITGPDALREIQARTIEGTAQYLDDNFGYDVGENVQANRLRELAAAKRKGE